MRIINLGSTNKKKVRGVKRKCNQMLHDINELTSQFPDVDLERGYWHMHLPVAQTFIDSTKTPMYVRKICVQTLINGVERLINIRPSLKITSRVIASIDLPNLSDSQIIVFFGEEYFNEFFKRDNEYQKWIPLPKERNLLKEWNLQLPEEFEFIGYKEEIRDEDYKAVNELWFIGELK